jgi:hypothetical protein
MQTFGKRTVDIDTNCILWILLHRDVYSVGTLSSFLGIRRPERVVGHSLLRSTEIMKEWRCALNPTQTLWLDGKTLNLLSNRGRCEGKTAVSIFWLELYNIITVSLDSGFHKPHTLPLISLALCGSIWLKIWISVLEFVHRVYLFRNLYFRCLLQTDI